MAEQRRGTREVKNHRNNNSGARRAAPRVTERQPQRTNQSRGSSGTSRGNGKRRRRRRGSLFLLYVLIGFLLTVTGITLSLTVLFNIEGYKINGNSRYNADEIINAIPIKKGDNLFRINKKNAVDKLEKSLPYLDKVKLSRGLPSSLVITVKELTAKYTFQSGEAFYLAAENYKILEKTSGIEPKTVYIKGLKLENPGLGELAQFKDQKQKNRLDLIISSLNESKLKDIQNIDIADSAAIKVLYGGRIKLLFGTTAELDKKIFAAEEIILRQKSSDAEGTLDLSKIESGNVKSVFKEEKIDE